MSQSIRISSGHGAPPILQHIPNTSSSSSSSSSCMFLSTEKHTCMEVGFPINLSVKECRKRAAWISSVVSNRNPRRFLPCAATLNSNVDGDDTSKGKYDDALKVLLLGVSQAWWTILSNFRSSFRYKVTKGVKSNVDENDTSKGGKYDDPLKVMLLGVSQAWLTILSNFVIKVFKGAVVLIIRMDGHDPIDGLRVLLDASRAWRWILSRNSDELFDAKEFDDHYGKSYLRKARMEGDINKGKHNKVKSFRSRIFTRVSIIRILADLNDPYDGLKILSGALESWRAKFSSNELNDSEGYLQKEIYAIRDLSHRIWVSNRNGKHDEAKNHLLDITHSLALYKLMIDNFDDPTDAIKARREAFRCYIEGVECDGIIGLMVDAVAKLNFDDSDDYPLWKYLFDA